LLLPPLLLLLLQDWVGQPYGSKVHCRPPGRGWVYLLAPTAELWTQVRVLQGCCCCCTVQGLAD
jgi:hypothetical protein